MGILDGKFTVNTKWSKGDIIKSNEETGQLSVDKNTITFHIDGSKDIFARNFVGHKDHTYKVFTYGPGESDTSGYFYIVSKVLLYNASDYTNFTGDNIEEIVSFSFEIPELTDWLSIPSVEFITLEDGTSIIHEISTPTITLKEKNPKIYIKYEIKDLLGGIDNQNEMSIKKLPRVFVEFDTPTYDAEVESTIEIVMRFFHY